MGIGSFPGAEAAGAEVLEKSRVIPLLSLRAFVAHKKDETYLHI